MPCWNTSLCLQVSTWLLVTSALVLCVRVVSVVIICERIWCYEWVWKVCQIGHDAPLVFQGLWVTKTIIPEDWGIIFLQCLNPPPSECSLILTTRINCSWLVTLHCVLSYSSGKSNCSFPVKLTLDWIRLDPKILQDSAFTSRLQIWPSLCKLLNGLQKTVADFATDKCK
jgi:hypothetical protein